MSHAGVQLGIADQQLGYFGVIPAFGVAFQRVGIILFQLVVKRPAAENGAALFLAAFFFHLPEKEGAELRPEVEVPHIVITQHRCVVQKPVQQIPGAGVAADHSRHFQIKALKGGKIQQKMPHRKIEPAIDGILEVAEHLPVSLRYDFRGERLAAGHTPRRNSDAQRVADGFFQDAVDFAFRHGCLAGSKKAAYILAVKKKVVRLQRGHKTRVLEGRQVRRRHPAGEEHKPARRVGTDQFTERLRGFLLLQKLKVVDQKDIPVFRQCAQREIRRIGTQPQRPMPAQQRIGQRRFAKAAGRTEKKNAAALHNAVKFLLHRWFYQNISGQF